jgi:hypothetical protein
MPVVLEPVPFRAARRQREAMALPVRARAFGASGTQR